ncbi:MAG: hypothetical protein QM493_09130 [Sulfurovum sp.]
MKKLAILLSALALTFSLSLAEGNTTTDTNGTKSETPAKKCAEGKCGQGKCG